MPIEKEDNKLEIEWMLQNSEISDRELVGLMVELYYQDLVNFASLLNSEPEHARKAALKAIDEVMANRHRYTGEQRLRVCLLGLTFQLSASQSKTVLLRSLADKLPWRSSENPGKKEQGVFYRWLWDEVGQDLACLPFKSSLVLLLRYAQNLSLEEIAYILGIKLETVREHLESTRSHLIGYSGFPQRIRAGFSGNGRFTSQEHLVEELTAVRDGVHDHARSEVRATADGLVLSYEVEGHLTECSECRDYTAAFAFFEGWLRNRLPGFWMAAEQPTLEVGETVDEVKRMTINRNRKRSLSIKEISLAVVIVAALGAWAYLGGLFELELEVKAITLATSVPNISPDQASLSSEASNNPQNGSALGSSSSLFAESSTLELDHLVGLVELVTITPVAGHSGPFNLSVLLHFWGWEHDTADIIKNLQSRPQEQLVSLEGMAVLVEEKTMLKAVVNDGGNLEEIRSLLAAGFPLIVQTGYSSQVEGLWTGNYSTIYGIDEGRNKLLMLTLSPDFGKKENFYPPDTERFFRFTDYQQFEKSWKHFGSSYLLVYPEDKKEISRYFQGDFPSERELFELARTEKIGIIDIP
jgi:DNA-directed RNA polymerase specialized sigma24 family protein